jgi:hypothetical protein
MERILGQIIYAGPTHGGLDLQYGRIYKNGIHDHLYNLIAACPSLGPLFVPVAQFALVRRELKLDIARNMRGTEGRYVQLYKEVQKWIESKSAIEASQPVKPKGVKIKHHA